MTTKCKYGESLCIQDDKIENGGKAAVGLLAAGIFMLAGSIVCGVLRIFHVGGKTGAAAAAGLSLFAALLLLSAWAIMIGVWLNYWDEIVRDIMICLC